MPIPNNKETHDEWIQRCMSDLESIDSFPDEKQRFAFCESRWENEKFAKQKISFDYDDTLSTKRGTDLAIELSKENTIYIISARNRKSLMLKKASIIGVPESRVYATGSNKAKIAKIKELGIDIHYDNNSDVVKELGKIGKKFNKLTK